MDFRDRREELWDTFEKSLRFSLENDVEIILISGDLYENESINKSHLDRLSFIFKKYNDLRFFISLGNHDHISEKSNYLDDITGNNVHIFKSNISFVEYKNIRVYGFSWDRLYYDSMPFLIPSLDRNYYNILNIHGMNENISNYLPLDIATLENSGFDYIALGHIHNNKKCGEISYYPGALEPLSFKCVGAHGGYLIDTDMDKIDFIELSKRKYNNIKIDISEINNNRHLFSTIFENLKEYNSYDIFRIYIEGRKSKNIELDEVVRAIKRDYKYIDIIDESKPMINFEKLLEKNNITSKYFDYIFKNFNDDINAQKALVEIGLNSFPIEESYED